MPTKLSPTDVAAPRSQPSPCSGARRRRLRTVLLTAVSVGLLLPASAVHAEPTSAEIQQRITRESSALTKIVEEYNKVREELKVTQAAAKKHAASLPTLQTQLSSAEAEVSQIAATAYKTGQLREMNAMLNGANSTALLDRVGTLDHLARGRQAQIDNFTTAKQRYNSEKLRLDSAQKKQQIQMRDLEARKKKIEKDLKKLFEMRRAAYGQEQESGSRYTGRIPSVSGKAGTAVTFAYNAIGKPYSWGADGPGGYDCSGLTLAARRAAGKSLPHNAAMQYNNTARISRSQLMPGDLVFYSGLSHVGLYVGNGNIIHAPTFGQNVKLADVDVMSPYGYGRVG